MARTRLRRPARLAALCLALSLLTPSLGAPGRAATERAPTLRGGRAAAQPPSPPPLLATWRPGPAPAPGGVVAPTDLVLDGAGGAFVLDRALGRVQRFGPDGRVSAVFGGPGPAPGSLDRPLGLALDAARGRLYVADTGHRRVVAFGQDGALELAWGGYVAPEALTVGLDGRVYTYDRGMNGIRVRRADGGDEGIFPVQVAQSRVAELPRGLATAPGDSIFFAAEAPVANAPNVLYEFSAAGEVLRPRTQLAWQIRDLDFGGGQLHLLDGSGSRLVTRLDRTNGQATATGLEPGAVALAEGPDGLAWLLYPASATAPAGIQGLAVAGDTVTPLGRRPFPELEAGWFDHPLRLEAAPDGSLLLVDTLARLERLGPGGGALGQWHAPGLLEAVLGADGRLYTARLRTHSPDELADPDAAPPGQRRFHVSAYALPGGLASAPDAVAEARLAWTDSWTEALDAADFSQVEALAFDAAASRLYLLDSGRRQVRRWDGAGNRLPPLPLPEAGDGVPGYTDLILGAGGELAVLHAASRQVLALAADGSPLARVSLPRLAYRLARDARGLMALLSPGRVVTLADASGATLASWPLPAGPGEASDLALGQDGRLYVADFEARAVYVFGRPRLYLPALGGG